MYIGGIMNKGLTIFISILQKLLGLLNIIVVLLVIINIFNLILTFLHKGNLISFLDYTYLIIEEEESYLELETGDFVLIDLKQSAMKEEMVLYEEDESIHLGKILDIGTENVIIRNIEGEVEIEKELVLGKVIKVIPVLGNVLNVLLTPITLIILIAMIIAINVNQRLIKKAKKKLTPEKPDFDKMKNVNI